MRAVRRQPLDRAERLRCYASLARWWLVNWNLLRVGIDVSALLAPSVSNLVYRVRDRYHARGIGARQH